MQRITFIYVTNPSLSVAKTIAKRLIAKRLIACANIFPRTVSLYRWKGRIAEEKEVILIGKAAERNYAAIRKEIEKIHPYTIPCITKISVHPNDAYAKWLLSETN